MSRLIPASIACIALIAVPAAAADLPPAPAPYRAPVVAAPVYYSWTGFYVGAHGGGAWADETSTNVFAIPGFAAAGFAVNSKASGAIGGGQAGFNYQFGSFVVGAEVDGSWSNANESVTFATLTPGVSGVAKSEMNWFATAALRAGFAVNDVLIYGKAGGAWMDVDYTASSVTAPGGVVIAGPVTFGNTRSGWMAGAGVEFGFWNNWSAKLEYNYFDFGTERYAFGPALGIPATTVDVDTQVHLVKAGVNWRFGGPVSAAY
jgi:outer membrane immunogenic protein